MVNPDPQYQFIIRTPAAAARATRRRRVRRALTVIGALVVIVAPSPVALAGDAPCGHAWVC